MKTVLLERATKVTCHLNVSRCGWVKVASGQQFCAASYVKLFPKHFAESTQLLSNMSSSLIPGITHPSPNSAANSFEADNFQVSIFNGLAFKVILRLVVFTGSSSEEHQQRGQERWVVSICHNACNIDYSTWFRLYISQMKLLLRGSSFTYTSVFLLEERFPVYPNLPVGFPPLWTSIYRYNSVLSNV